MHASHKPANSDASVCFRATQLQGNASDAGGLHKQLHMHQHKLSPDDRYNNPNACRQISANSDASHVLTGHTHRRKMDLNAGGLHTSAELHALCDDEAAHFQPQCTHANSSKFGCIHVLLGRTQCREMASECWCIAHDLGGMLCIIACRV